MDQEVETGFDLLVTHRDERTGLITHSNPYIMRAVKAPDGGTRRLWERPSGSGNLFDKKNNPIGRWVVDAKTKVGSFVENAAHVAFAAPETKDQKLARSLTEKDGRIADLEKRLIEAEAKKKQGS